MQKTCQLLVVFVLCISPDLFGQTAHSRLMAAEVGIASVFYDRIVACAPFRINPYRTPGVAHKTLPCGTLVEVVNRRNGKRITAPVVDLGPCTSSACRRGPKRISKRILDLLPMTARAIGHNGLERVRVTEIK